MNDIEAQKIVTMLVTAFPTTLARLSEDQQRDTMRIYREMIKDVDARLAGQAVRGLISTCKFLPTIAEVREACMIAKYGRRRPGGDAWGDVVKALKRYGYTRSPGRDFTFEDQLVARAVGALGWAELCKSDNAIADRARFIELYDHLANNVRSDAQVSAGVTSRELQSGDRRLERGAPLRELLPGGEEK
jgi:hypothetical protein